MEISANDTEPTATTVSTTFPSSVHADEMRPSSTLPSSPLQTLSGSADEHVDHVESSSSPPSSPPPQKHNGAAGENAALSTSPPPRTHSGSAGELEPAPVDVTNEADENDDEAIAQKLSETIKTMASMERMMADLKREIEINTRSGDIETPTASA